MCPTAVRASSFCPFLQKIFSRTSGLNSILTASKSFIQRWGVMMGKSEPKMKRSCRRVAASRSRLSGM